MNKENNQQEMEPGLDENQDLEIVNIEEIGKKKTPKRTTFDFVRYGVIAVALIVIVVASINLYKIFSEYNKGEDTYQEINDTIPTATWEAVEATGDTVTPYEFHKLQLDFDEIKKINSDIVGWIQFEGVDISYPILQSVDDEEYYLYRMYNREENKAGSIFVNSMCSSDLEDYHYLIFGHNMKNLSMFGSLKEYKKKDYYQGKECFWVYTPNGNFRYKIYSVHEVKADSPYFKIFLTKNSEYGQFIQSSIADSRYKTGVDVTENDKIVTLATCTARGKEWRLLLHAKLIGTERFVVGTK